MSEGFVNIKPGTVVWALAGREKGRCFVAAASDGGFVYLADGKERKLSKPKKKSMKHISPAEGFIELSGLTDRKLRGLLRGFGPYDEACCHMKNE